MTSWTGSSFLQEANIPVTAVIAKPMPSATANFLNFFILNSFSILTFQRSDHDALDEVLLHERIEHDDRYSRQNDGGKAHGFQRSNAIFRGDSSPIIDVRTALARQKQFPQNKLQGKFGAGTEIDHGIEIGIPLSNDRIHGYDDDDRTGQRKAYMQEEAEIGTTVDAGRFKQFLADSGHKILSDDDDVPY